MKRTMDVPVNGEPPVKKQKPEADSKSDQKKEDVMDVEPWAKGLTMDQISKLMCPVCYAPVHPSKLWCFTGCQHPICITHLRDLLSRAVKLEGHVPTKLTFSFKPISCPMCRAKSVDLEMCKPESILSRFGSPQLLAITAFIPDWKVSDHQLDCKCPTPASSSKWWAPHHDLFCSKILCKCPFADCDVQFAFGGRDLDDFRKAILQHCFNDCTHQVKCLHEDCDRIRVKHQMSKVLKHYTEEHLNKRRLIVWAASCITHRFKPEHYADKSARDGLLEMMFGSGPKQYSQTLKDKVDDFYKSLGGSPPEEGVPAREWYDMDMYVFWPPPSSIKPEDAEEWLRFNEEA